MRFGYCTGFATPVKDRIDYRLLENIAAAGYDYAEFPLALLSSLSEEDFTALSRHLEALGLACDACCNMFPARVRLIGPEEDDETVREYLRLAVPRMRALGAQTLVLGSSGARNLPEGMTKEEGVRSLSRVVGEVVVPFLECYGLTLVMEPIGSYEANFINTLPDGMEIVRAVNHPRVQLLADSVHLLYEREDPAHIVEYASHLRHIHLCENERALPLEGLTPELAAIVDALRQIGYDGRASFEPMPYDLPEMRRALETIKKAFA